MMWILSLLLSLGVSLAQDVTVPNFGLFVPSVLYYPSNEKFCIHTDGDLREFSDIQIHLESSSGNSTLNTVSPGHTSPLQCGTFEVPAPIGIEEEAFIKVQGLRAGDSAYQFSKKTVTILRKQTGTFVQTDKAVYKPGQTVQFRIVTLNQDFEASSEEYPLVELQDPQFNRLAQWTDVSPNSGIVDLSFQLSPEPPLGSYTIKTGATKHYFSVQEYVLPKFEVTIKAPSSMTILDENVALTVCARYTHGQPVTGRVTVRVCQGTRNYYWRWALPQNETEKLCYTSTEQNDLSGCLKSTVNLSHFRVRNPNYNSILEVAASLEEEGTGVMINATSKQCQITSQITKLSFKESRSYYQPGALYRGKLLLQSFDGTPLSDQKLHLSVSFNEGNFKETFITDSSGEVSFQLDTSKWGTNAVSLQAHTDKRDEEYTYGKIAARYGHSYLSLADMYVVSNNSVHIRPVNGSAACDRNVSVYVDYTIREEQGDELDFFYLVLVNGKITITGQHTAITAGINATFCAGSIEFSLPVRDVSPSGKLLVFTVSRFGHVAADTITFDVTPCLKDDVNLGFSEDEAIPGSKVKLHLGATPGSLCALRVVDKSVVLMKPEDELTETKIQNLFHSNSYGRRYNGDSLDYNLCHNRKSLPNGDGSSTSTMTTWNDYYMGYPEKKKDVEKLIKDMGLTILSSWKIVAPVTCKFDYYEMRSTSPSVVMEVTSTFRSYRQHDTIPETSKVRTFFPETWIWNLEPISSSGTAEISVTVPDSITEWKAMMFCTGVGRFGLSPTVSLVAFKPFFVEQTLPYSVKRGETFILKASVFNYLSQCIKIEVILSPSEDFSVKNISSCDYSFCLCTGEKRTATWELTPNTIGKINITVTSEAVSSKELCGGQVTVVPVRGHRDSMTKPLLVEPEGVLVEQTHNSLLLCEGNTISEHVSLELPQTWVKGSERASFSVFGDIMASALNNVESLLVMSSGCGEQNMVRFAPNIFILQYLEMSNQLTPQFKQKGHAFLTGGYQRELQYKHAAGCYSAFGEHDKEGSTWLTAFVIKCFGQARPFIFIDEQNIRDGIKWLEKQQKPNGCFQTSGRLLNNNMKGGVDDEVSLTAYIVAALMEISMMPNETMVERGLQCLKNASLEKASTYKLAIVAYAFTLADFTHPRSELLLKLEQQAVKSDGVKHWTQKFEPAAEGTFWSKPKSVDVELTSYVLLSMASARQVLSKDLGDMMPIVRWLSKQQNANGGFCSTQDTVVALQALTKFASLTFSNAGSVTVMVTQEKGFQKQFHVHNGNRLLLQRASLPDIPGEYTVTATGNGTAYIQITERYHTLPPERDAAFNLTVVAECIQSTLLQIVVEFWYSGERSSSNMALVEVKMMSGYVLQKESIDQLKKNPLVRRVETKEDIVTIYLEKVTAQIQTLVLRAEQQVQVMNLKPAIVTIFDYYMPDEKKTVKYLIDCP